MPTGFEAGAPCWFDVTAPDVPATAEFYTALFGWTAADTGSENRHYTLLFHDDTQVAGIATAQTPDGLPTPAMWLPYFAVDEVPATVDAATAAGAAICCPFTEVPGAQFAILADPDGAGYGVLRPDDAGNEGFRQPGNPCWVQYAATRDPATALKHYAAVLGWISRTAAWETAVDNPYQAVTTAAGGAEFGGAALAAPGTPAPQWTVTIHVLDCDATAARAVALGGTVIEAPHDNPGPSRLAVIADPNGATLALMSFGGRDVPVR